MAIAKNVTALAAVLCLSTFRAAADEPPATVIDGASADTVLKPGDVLVKFLGPTTKTDLGEKVVQGGQKVIKRLRESFHRELKKGDPNALHTILYLGRGQTADTRGTTGPQDAHVGLFKLEVHDGHLFQVYRPKDASLAAAAAKVAEAWATPNRMKYKLPVGPVRFAYFGPAAKKDALDYGKNAARVGGPPDVKAMFCSEFVVAVYQAAIVERQLAKNARLDARHVTMPLGVNLQASHTSPFAFHSHLIEAVAKKQWQRVGDVLVKKH